MSDDESSGQANGPIREVRSGDGSLTFRMQRTRSGVTVTRGQLRTCGSRIEMAAVFASRADFKQFCDADPLRFSHPVVFVRARSEFDALLDS